MYSTFYIHNYIYYNTVIKNKNMNLKKLTNSIAWRSISIIIIVLITSFYGISIKCNELQGIGHGL